LNSRISTRRIIDAYCKILLIAKQLGRVNYFTEQETSELMEFKKRLKMDDPRLHIKDCELCGPSVFDHGYSDFVPETVRVFSAMGRSR